MRTLLPALLVALLPLTAHAAVGKSVQVSPTKSHLEKGGMIHADHATPVALAIARQLADKLGDIDGIFIEVKGAEISVEGDVATADELDRVTKVIDRENELTPQSDHEIVIVLGKSAHITVPFGFHEALNSNPNVIETHADLANREVTFFAKREGLATYTIVNPKNRKQVLEYDLRIVPDRR